MHINVALSVCSTDAMIGLDQSEADKSQLPQLRRLGTAIRTDHDFKARVPVAAKQPVNTVSRD
jgi:hypothetical protein